MSARVSVVIPAYDLGRFLGRAIDSALGQDWPVGELEVIVVDDGSTDDTAAVLATYGERVHAISQPNRGFIAAVNRGLEAVTGDYVALLDADDEWPADKVRRQVEFLDANPAVGLVHGDMTVIDSDGAVLAASFFAQQGIEPTAGRVLGRLLGGNFVSGGAAMWRAALLPVVYPIAGDATYPDWWIAANVAAVAEIDHLPGCFNRYRYHGANMCLGADAQAQDAIVRKEIPWRRWMLRHLVDDPSVTASELVGAYRGWEYGLVRGALSAGAAARDMLAVTAEQRERAAVAAEAGAQALRNGDGVGALRLLLCAVGEDPWDGATRYDVEVAVGALAARPQPVAPAPPLLAEMSARPHLTLAWAGELVRHPRLLKDYCAHVADATDATLAVLVDSDAELAALAELADGAHADLLALPRPATLPARRLLAARARALLTLESALADFVAVQRHPVAALAGSPS